MERAKAIIIAHDFIENMNPDHWNGVGNKPKSFKDYSQQRSLTKM